MLTKFRFLQRPIYLLRAIKNIFNIMAKTFGLKLGNVKSKVFFGGVENAMEISTTFILINEICLFVILVSSRLALT